MVYLMDELVQKLDLRDPRFATAIVKHSTGTSGELEVLEKCEYADTRKWIEEKLTSMLGETASTEGPSTVFNNPLVRRAHDAAEMLDHLALIDQAAAADHARALFKTKEPAWTLAVLFAIHGGEAPVNEDTVFFDFTNEETRHETVKPLP